MKKMFTTGYMTSHNNILIVLTPKNKAGGKISLFLRESELKML